MDRCLRRRYRVDGEPIALARPRYGKNRVWDAQKNLKLHYGLDITNQHADERLFLGPLQIEIAFYFPFPKNMSQRKKDEMRYNFRPIKPDIDNLIKWVLDVCNGILYEDDAIITSLSAYKMYDDVARTEFVIHELYEHFALDFPTVA